MTKPKLKHTVLPEQLADALLDLLRAGPRTADDLARHTGYSSNAVRERLGDLRKLGHIHRKTQPRADGGMHYVWHAGDPVGRIPSLVKARDKNIRRIGQPHQVTVTSYAPFPYRDRLVSALFGPARREAA